MSLVIRFSPPSLTAEQYDSAVRRLTEEGVFPSDGLDYEICFGKPGNFKVSQVWDSQEQLDALARGSCPFWPSLALSLATPKSSRCTTSSSDSRVRRGKRGLSGGAVAFALLQAAQRPCRSLGWSEPPRAIGVSRW